MTENISLYVKSIVHDTRNRVNDGMKCVGKGLWHEDCNNSLSEDGRNSVFCITPYGMVQKNAVFATKPKGESKETTCTADSMRIVIGNNVVVALTIYLTQQKQSFHSIHLKVFIKPLN